MWEEASQIVSNVVWDSPNGANRRDQSRLTERKEIEKQANEPAGKQRSERKTIAPGFHKIPP
jgi:hypothetical protein